MMKLSSSLEYSRDTQSSILNAFESHFVNQRSRIPASCLYARLSKRGFTLEQSLAEKRITMQIIHRKPSQITTIMSISNHKPAFLLHLLIETPASLSFFLSPSSHLRIPQPHAHRVIQQYAVLLMSTNIIAAVFAFRPLDDTASYVAGALALYHIMPIIRAIGRLTEEGSGRVSGVRGLGGPKLHLVVHSVCLMLLSAVFVSRVFGNVE